jgi:hypothetical protein
VLGPEAIEPSKLLPTLKFYCHLARQRFYNPSSWDQPAEVPDLVAANLETWYNVANENKPVHPWKGRVPFTRIIATDASARGAGLMCWCIETNTLYETVVEWQRFGHSSSDFETEALMLAAEIYRDPSLNARTLAISDNSPAVEAVNRRFSYKDSLNDHIDGAIDQHQIRAVHYPGVKLVRLDALSRGKESTQTSQEMIEIMKEMATIAQGGGDNQVLLLPSRVPKEESNMSQQNSSYQPIPLKVIKTPALSLGSSGHLFHGRDDGRGGGGESWGRAGRPWTNASSRSGGTFTNGRPDPAARRLIRDPAALTGTQTARNK